MLHNDNFKFRIEISIKKPQKGFENLNQFIICYGRAITRVESESFENVTELGDPAFGAIAEWVADEYLLSRVSASKDFVFGNYGYEDGATNMDEHYKIFWKIQRLVFDCLRETFNHDFFEFNKDNLDPKKLYEYVFDVSFEVDGDNLKRTKLDVKKSEWQKNHWEPFNSKE